MNKFNKDEKVIRDFGQEWLLFNHFDADLKELTKIFHDYFNIFPWDLVSNKSSGFDMGCGTGRWAQFVANRVGHLHCIDPSNAIHVAKTNLKDLDNVSFLQETTDTCSLQAGTQDFGYSLGVLHHIPDTQAALVDCAKLLKKGAPFLLYLYYKFDNKPLWFRLIWKTTDYFRRIISLLPHPIKRFICSLIAYFIYFPFSRMALLLEMLKVDVSNFPLAYYRNQSLYILKNDALDRFGTKLEQRFSKEEIKQMLEKAGFRNITFSNSAPYWCCISIKE